MVFSPHNIICIFPTALLQELPVGPQVNPSQWRQDREDRCPTSSFHLNDILYSYTLYYEALQILFPVPLIVDIHYVRNSFYYYSEGRYDTTPTLLLHTHVAPVLEERLWTWWKMFPSTLKQPMLPRFALLSSHVWCQQLLGKFQYANF